MKLHLLSIPHTVTREDFSHCAFTMKVKNFSPMLRARGFDVIHYGVAGADSGATEDVELMSQEEHLELLHRSIYHEDPTALVGNDANDGNDCYRQFNFYLRDALMERLEEGDIICLPFGLAHDAAYKTIPLVQEGKVTPVETGIGYPRPSTFARIYESNAWRHWVLGNEQREGMGWQTKRMEWVIPNYYNISRWPGQTDPQDRRRVVFLGRLEEVKGLEIIPKLAVLRPDLDFVICGQGDPKPFLGPKNVHYKPPINGVERALFLGNALCGIYPSRFVEPFCGAAVETMLCGTPVLTSDFGAFTETVEHGETGYRCRGIETWLRALNRVEQLERRLVRAITIAKYDLNIVGHQYARAFNEIIEGYNG